MTRRREESRKRANAELDERVYAWAVEQELKTPPHATTIIEVAKKLGISEVQAKEAIERLERARRLNKINSAGVWSPIMGTGR